MNNKYRYVLVFRYDYYSKDTKEKMIKAHSKKEAEEIVGQIMDSDHSIQMGYAMTLWDYGLNEYYRNKFKRELKLNE